MEISVYGWQRWAVVIALPIMFIPPIAAFAMLASNPGFAGGIPNDLLLVLAAVLVATAVVNLVVLALVSAQVRIDRDERKVARCYRLFGWTPWQREYPLAEFDRISLQRGPRGGYVVRLVGREREIVLFSSGNLKQARQTAEDAAACCRLALNDQL